MQLNQRVEYQVGRGESGFGRVVGIDEATERVTVCDEEDGSMWSGSMDHAQPCDEPRDH